MRLADEFIALDVGEGLPEFLAWAEERHAGASKRRASAEAQRAHRRL